MFEYHGWVVIRESPREVDDGGLAAVVEDLGRFLCQPPWQSRGVTLANYNGLTQLTVGRLSNHSGSTHADLIALLERIGRDASGSYGIVHFHDDEAEVFEQRNEFRAIYLRRGVVKELVDLNLSPIVPTIEDP